LKAKFLKEKKFLILILLNLTLAPAFAQEDQGSLILAPAREGGLWGYINQRGEWVIKPQYGEAKNFHENLAEVVQYNGDNFKTGFINKDNKWIFQLPELNYSHFSEGRLAFLEGGAYGFMDSLGNKVIPAQFKYCSNFEGGKAMVVFKNGKAGYINRLKQLLLSPRWDTAFNFQGKFAVVGKKDVKGKFNYGVIDNYGNTLIPFQYSWITNFSHDLAFANKGGINENRIIKGGKWYIVDMTQQTMLPLCDTSLIVEIDNYNEIYSNLLKFKEGLAWFPGRYNGQIVFGIMNPVGDWKVLPQYKIVNRISEEMAGVFMNGRMGFINLNGKLVIPCSYKSVGVFHNGLAWFKEDKKYGFLNKKGEIIITPSFEEVGDFMIIK
jgi:hypothetical protein